MKELLLLSEKKNNHLPALTSNAIPAERVPGQPAHIRIKQLDKGLSENTKKPGSHTLSSLHSFQKLFQF